MPYARNGDLSLYYEAVGAGEPVVWLQGLGADHTAWSVQMFHFSKRFLCVLPDARDTGRSSRATEDYDLDMLAEDVLHVMDNVGLEDAHIVGLSMGGSVAQHIALSAPGRVRSLALLSAFARSDARLQAVLELWPQLFEKLGRVLFHRQSEPWMFSPDYLSHPSNLRALRRYVESAPNPQDAAAFTRQVRASVSHDTLSELYRIKVRTLVVSGERDILVPPYLGERLAEGIAGASFVVRPRIAHSVNLEGQREFNSLIEAFLKS